MICIRLCNHRCRPSETTPTQPLVCRGNQIIGRFCRLTLANESRVPYRPAAAHTPPSGPSPLTTKLNRGLKNEINAAFCLPFKELSQRCVNGYYFAGAKPLGF